MYIYMERAVAIVWAQIKYAYGPVAYKVRQSSSASL